MNAYIEVIGHSRGRYGGKPATKAELKSLGIGLIVIFVVCVIILFTGLWKTRK